jgi:hypothetical protein
MPPPATVARSWRPMTATPNRPAACPTATLRPQVGLPALWRTGPLAERSEQILSKKVCDGRGLDAPTYERGPSGAATTESSTS